VGEGGERGGEEPKDLDNGRLRIAPFTALLSVPVPYSQSPGMGKDGVFVDGVRYRGDGNGDDGRGREGGNVTLREKWVLEVTVSDKGRDLRCCVLWGLCHVGLIRSYKSLPWEA
jgi:hypothetical protein